jgi:very-short-patch-repair endonuclease
LAHTSAGRPELSQPFETEYRFQPKRRWRFDFAIPQHMLAIEVVCGTWTNGRHTRGRGYERDAEKHNAAAALGWRTLHFSTSMVMDGRAKQAISEALGPTAAAGTAP